MRIFVRALEEHKASPPFPTPAVPLGPSVAHPSLATAVQARDAVAPGALHDQPFSARTETWSGRELSGGSLLSTQPLVPGMASAASMRARAASVPLP